LEPLTLAIDVAREAGALLLRYLHRPLEIREKELRADIVTDADRASERLIIERLSRAYPSAAILSEESGERAGWSLDQRWIVDPLDGTTNFAHGYPLFCISIAYEERGELVAGVVYAPAMQELFVAQRGGGARLNDREIAVSEIAELAGAMICTGFLPSKYERNARQFGAISNRAQAVRRDGAAALDLAYVACGRFDGFWEFDLHAWDVAAGTLLIREAGGTVTMIENEAMALDSGSILATNGRLHDELRRTLTAPART
jgi:myo-inositol-1(or 4)-monophosphatase